MLNLLNSNTVAKNTCKLNNKDAHMLLSLHYDDVGLDKSDCYWAHFVTVTWQWSDDVEGITFLKYDAFDELRQSVYESRVAELVVNRREQVGLALYNALTKDVDGVIRQGSHAYSKTDDKVETNIALGEYGDLQTVKDVFTDTYSSHYGQQQTIVIAIKKDATKEAIKKIDSNFDKFAKQNNITKTVVSFKKQAKKKSA